MPFFVPLANQHTSMDPSFIPLLRATLTKLLNNVGVGDMVFGGVGSYPHYGLYLALRGGCFVVMPSLQGCLFILREVAVNRVDPILSWVSINPLTFVSRPWPTYNRVGHSYTHSLLYSISPLYSISLRCIQVGYPYTHSDCI